ncbi:MAG TPA: SprT family zinc-dependent metalloprotease [Lachnospiraceae bacterium]|nr:SprT family zinc-dependent metalloprotease [Lachnospiraceae bacterium]
MKDTVSIKEENKGYKDYEHLKKMLYLGSLYPIIISVDKNLKQNHIAFEKEILHLYSKEDSEEVIKKALKRFYYQECKALIEGRIRIYQSEFKTKPRSIRISDNNSTWGTCSSKFEFTFHWKLAMAPIDVINYVVVHEMCHMVHLNHDRSFWRLVGKMLPNYEERKNYLANYGHMMVL